MAELALDHLVIGAASLAQGVAWAEETLGDLVPVLPAREPNRQSASRQNSEQWSEFSLRNFSRWAGGRSTHPAT